MNRTSWRIIFWIDLAIAVVSFGSAVGSNVLYGGVNQPLTLMFVGGIVIAGVAYVFLNTPPNRQ